jgi:hypothetical protein
MAAVQDPLAPLIDLVNRLRGELDEDVLEAKRARLRLAEATLELLRSQRQKDAPASEEGGSGVKGASEAGARGSEDEGVMAPDQPIAHTQASGRCGRGFALLISRRDANKVVCALCQVAGGKRARDEGEPPRLSLATALPLSVWQEYLVPMMSIEEAKLMRCVCKALRGVVDECPMKLGRVSAKKLKAALTCFPAAQSLDMALEGPLPAAKEGGWVEVLRKHGATLKRVTAEDMDAEELLWSAVRAGALPKLSYFDLMLADPVHRQLLTDGRLRMVEELHVATRGFGNAEEPLRALEHLRQLPLLRELTIEGEHAPVAPAVFPAFIPPSLKTLTLNFHQAPLLESLLLQLPPMLQASGAGLEEIKFSPLEPSAACGAALARVLNTCSPTLKTLHIVGETPKGPGGTPPSHPRRPRAW